MKKDREFARPEPRQQFAKTLSRREVDLAVGSDPRVAARSTRVCFSSGDIKCHFRQIGRLGFGWFADRRGGGRLRQCGRCAGRGSDKSRNSNQQLMSRHISHRIERLGLLRSLMASGAHSIVQSNCFPCISSAFRVYSAAGAGRWIAGNGQAPTRIDREPL